MHLLLRYLFPVAALITVFILIYLGGLSDGKESTQRKWDAEKLLQGMANEKALLDALAKNEAIKQEHLLELDRRKDKYEAAINSIMSTRSTGLQLPKGACPKNPPSLPRDTKAPSGTTDSPLEGRLPDKVEQSLRAIMHDANICTQRLLELQDFATSLQYNSNKGN